MSTRVIRDRSGTEWEVFEVHAAPHQASTVHPELAGGWLCFQSATGKRRLGNPPADWSTLADDALLRLLERARVERPSRAAQRAHPARPARLARLAADPARARADALGPVLDEVEQELTRSMEQVCEAPPARDLDTGELIRIEETLAIAAEAAKEAVSLRRKLRADRDAPDAS